MLEIYKELEEYILAHTEDEDEILKELSRETHVNMLRSRMLSGHLQGKLLQMICKMINPKCILEIGTFTGYSAISMALGSGENCIIHTIDCNDELENFTRKFIQKSGYENKIHFHIGDALQMIPCMNIEFDFVFIDADKRKYIEYFETVYPKLKKGGFVLADDVLWNGKILDRVKNNDKQTQGILAFNDFIQKHKNLENVLLPIRHGLMLIRKK